MPRDTNLPPAAGPAMIAMIARAKNMEPFVSPGHRIFTRPDPSPRVGKRYLFVRRDGFGVVRELLGKTRTHWKVCQYSPKRRGVLHRRTWPDALAIEWIEHYPADRLSPAGRVVTIALPVRSGTVPPDESSRGSPSP